MLTMLFDTINDWANDKRTKISDLQIDKDVEGSMGFKCRYGSIVC